MLEKLKAEIEEGWEDEEKELRDAFEKIDKEGKGTVDRARIGDLAKEMGRPMEEWELDVAMNHMDADGNGKVDYDEFAVWWEKNDARLKFTGRTGKPRPDPDGWFGLRLCRFRLLRAGSLLRCRGQPSEHCGEADGGFARDDTHRAGEAREA